MKQKYAKYSKVSKLYLVLLVLQNFYSSQHFLDIKTLNLSSILPEDEGTFLFHENTFQYTLMFYFKIHWQCWVLC